MLAGVVGWSLVTVDSHALGGCAACVVPQQLDQQLKRIEAEEAGGGSGGGGGGDDSSGAAANASPKPASAPKALPSPSGSISDDYDDDFEDFEDGR